LLGALFDFGQHVHNDVKDFLGGLIVHSLVPFCELYALCLARNMCPLRIIVTQRTLP